MTDRTKPVTVAHDKRNSRASELPEVVLRNLEDPSKSKRVPHPGKPLPPRSEMKKIPAKATTSKENIAAGSERDPPTVETPEPAVLKPGLMHQRRRSNSAGPVMTPDKRTRDQLSPSPIPEPKKLAADSKLVHIIPSTPQSPSPVRRSGASTPSYGSVEEGLDSTSYAYICSHGGEERFPPKTPRPATPSHGPTSYAAAVSAPTSRSSPSLNTCNLPPEQEIQRTRNRKMIAHKRLLGEPKDTRP
ncbi:hypothetical protein EVAR_89264_1 [Eumeta japonica]|uniref:Uncharacterized protein n=1 Tax=Eumeta variegata TaxID=151549 RepID=A0A4C1VKW1_EUMVA|nr:hypothetical protein EVAR_89264_1 [Eumeta japonica]